MTWYKCRLILVPVADIDTDSPTPTLTWASYTAIHEAHLTPHGLTYTNNNQEGIPLLIVTGVPLKVEYQTKVTDLVTEDNIVRIVTEFVADCQITMPPSIYLPEAGLASVPMKNQTRIQWALQAKINAQVSSQLQALHRRGEVKDLSRFLALSAGSLLIPLKDISELQN